MSLYGFSVWLHILAACVWIGGMAMLAMVLVPVTRSMQDRRLASRLIHQVASGFRPVAWGSLVLLLVTGFTNLLARGLGPERWLAADFWRSDFGTTLGAKLALFVLVVALSRYHDVSGPRASRLLQEQPGSPEAQAARRQASMMGRVTMLLSLLIVALAVGLVRGC